MPKRVERAGQMLAKVDGRWKLLYDDPDISIPSYSLKPSVSNIEAGVSNEDCFSNPASVTIFL